MEVLVRRLRPACAIALVAVPALSFAALATSGSNDASRTSAITVELNKLEAIGRACRGYFVVRNRTPEAIGELRLDVFLFDKPGLILRRVGLTFTDLPPERTKVALFDLTEGACEEIGRVLVNAVVACTNPRGGALPGCAEMVRTSTRAHAEFE